MLEKRGLSGTKTRFKRNASKIKRGLSGQIARFKRGKNEA